MHGQYGRLAGEVQLVEVCLNGVASGPGGPAPWRAQGLFPEAVPHLGSALHSLGTLFKVTSGRDCQTIQSLFSC